MFKLLKKIKWTFIAIVIIAVMSIMIGFAAQGAITGALIWPISIFGVITFLCLVFYKIYSCSSQPASEFVISISSKIESPILSFGRYTLKYKVKIEDKTKRIEQIVITNDKIVKLKWRDKDKPFEYLEMVLTRDILSIETMIREIYPRCRIFRVTDQSS